MECLQQYDFHKFRTILSEIIHNMPGKSSSQVILIRISTKIQTSDSHRLIINLHYHFVFQVKKKKKKKYNTFHPEGIKNYT